MSRRSERLQPAVDQAEQRQKEALRKFAEQQQRLTYFQQQLDDLKRYRQDYGINNVGGLTVSALLNRQQFVDRIDLAIVEQSRLIERQQRSLDAARDVWTRAHARASALDSVVVRYRTQESQSDQRGEQAEIDERMQYRRRVVGSV
jgi:flagellar FliJ protein